MESITDSSELNLKLLWESLRCLVKPTDCSENEEIKDLRGAFHYNLKRAIVILNLDDVEKIPHQGCEEKCGSSLLWDFVETALFILLQLKVKVEEEDLSVSQQKDIRSCLQFVVSLGICPHVMPGTSCSMSNNSAMFNLSQEQVCTELQKYERLCIVVQSLLTLCESSNFRSLIVSNIITQLLIGLFQLSYAPVKKPIQDNIESTSSDSNFIMTLDIWNRIQNNKLFFQKCLIKFVQETYQPKIMFELMVLQGHQRDVSAPIWLRKASSSILTSCLIQPGGVASLIRAAFDSAPDTGTDWKKTQALAKVITGSRNHHSSIATQLLKLIKISETGFYDMHLVVMACIIQLLEKDAAVCHSLIIEPLLQPLTQVYIKMNEVGKDCDTLLREEEVESLINVIHACFASPNSEVSSVNLPAKILLPYTSFFFKLFCRVNGSISPLCKNVENIIFLIFHDSNLEDLTNICKCLLLEEKQENMHLFSSKFSFHFGASGGVSLGVCSESNVDLFSSAVEDSGNMLMILLERRSDSELSILVFEVLLKMLVEIGMKPKKINSTTLGTVEDTIALLMAASEKHLGIVRLLAALVEKDNVRQKLCEKPEPILAFIVNLFDSLSFSGTHSSCGEDEDLECVFVGFMILNTILDNCGEDTNWSLFSNLLRPVSKIRDGTRNNELKRLASGVFNIISTCGVSLKNVQTNQKACQKTKCEEALHDACDTLLPVRGHALVQLGKLLQQRDEETLLKKEAVLCLFKENLKNSDSFIYLAAINGMVDFASLQPDETVHVLTKEFVHISLAGEDSERNPELRMKVGEILVKLVRKLGELAPKFKNELLNAFLIGAKDVDHLMRASSLSNLGEVCQTLGFRVGPILRELLICVQSILRFDKAIEPRRASVMVVTLLLRGLDADAFTVLQDAALELYRNLKSVYCEDEDDVVRLHAQLALEELGKLAQDILFPKLPMKKKIHILQ